MRQKHCLFLYSIYREYVGEFCDEGFHGQGTLRFSDYVDCDLSRLNEGDWDVLEGTFKHGALADGRGKLSYNHGTTRVGDGNFFNSGERPPCIRGSLVTPYECDNVSGNLSPDDPREMFGCVGDVYIGDFKNQLIHGRGTYWLIHPKTRRTVSYKADWMYGIRVGGGECPNLVDGPVTTMRLLVFQRMLTLSATGHSVQQIQLCRKRSKLLSLPVQQSPHTLTSSNIMRNF